MATRAATRVRLTAGRIAAFACLPGKQQAFLHDAEVPSLALRVTAAGAKSFVFEGKIDRRSVRITIGSVSDWSIDAARARAREFAALIDRGIDPREALRQQREAIEAERRKRIEAERAKARQETPALTVWRTYCEERKAVWGARHYADHLSMAHPGGEPRKRGGGVTQPGPLYELLTRPLAQLTPAVLEHWAEVQAAARPTVARLALRLLKAFLNWCREHPAYRDLVPEQTPITRKAREALGTAKAKTDALQREQLAAWFAATEQLHPVIAAYLQALLLTGARPGELRTIEWSDVDFRWRTLTIRDKVEGERTIPLTPYVAARLAQLPRRGDYVFMTERGSGPIATPNRQMNKACAIAGIPPVSLHGLRRSFGALSEWVEAPAGVVAQLMGHKPSAIAEKHYRPRPLDLLRMWHTKIEAFILDEAGIEQPRSDTVQRLRVVS